MGKLRTGKNKFVILAVVLISPHSYERILRPLIFHLLAFNYIVALPLVLVSILFGVFNFIFKGNNFAMFRLGSEFEPRI